MAANPGSTTEYATTHPPPFGLAANGVRDGTFDTFIPMHTCDCVRRRLCAWIAKKIFFFATLDHCGIFLNRWAHNPLTPLTLRCDAWSLLGVPSGQTEWSCTYSKCWMMDDAYWLRLEHSRRKTIATHNIFSLLRARKKEKSIVCYILTGTWEGSV